MKLGSSDAQEKGGLSMLLLHCVFNQDGSVNYFSHTIDNAMYEQLPHLYAVCVADNSRAPRSVVAGFFIKTTYTHHDADFVDALNNAMHAESALQHFVGASTSLLPARVAITGTPPPTEGEMLRLLTQQALKHGAAGSA